MTFRLPRSFYALFALCAACGVLERGGALPTDTTGNVTDVAGADGSEGDTAGNGDGPALSFASDGVHDILLAGCAGVGCHSGAGTEYVLTGSVSSDFDATLDVVTPGDARNSRLLRKAAQELSHSGGPVLIPGDADYDLIAAWINDGANP